MREIKFRAWHKADKKIYEVIAFNLSKWFLRGKAHPMPRSAIELLQYTGLKDKNGVEIYEGDLIKFWSGSESEEDAQISVVKWWVDEDNNYPAFDLDHNMISNYYFESNVLSELSEWCIDFYVIGNIHEHPHLLENK